MGLFVSCDDDLDVTPKSVINAQSFWKTSEDALSGRNGMLDKFRSTFNGREFLFKFELRTGFWFFGESGGGAGSSTWLDLFDNDINVETTPGLSWENYYKLINSANLVLKYTPDIEFNDQAVQNEILADAYFIRAFTYFQLARFWGDVPLVLNGFESDDDPDLFPERIQVEQVFSQIKSDIDAALTNIGSNNSARNRIFASKDAINMLKADVYLWTAKRRGGGSGDIDLAETAVDQVLSSNNSSLLSSFESVFRNDGNDEIIFSIYFDVGEGPNQFGDQFSFQAAPVPSDLRNNPIPIGVNQWYKYRDRYVDNWLLKEPLDSRNGIVSQDYHNGVRLFRWVNKYLGVLDGSRFFVNNTPIYRRAEAVLYKSEILAAKGNISGSIVELNRIAERAYGIANYYGSVVPAPSSQQDLENAILNERLIEFGAEGKSWFDIIRFGRAFDGTIIPELLGRENDNEGNILLLPVSNTTISLNPKINQTPGY